MSRERSPPPPPSADPLERNTPRRDRPNPGPRVGSRSGPCMKRPGGDPPKSYRGGWGGWAKSKKQRQRKRKEKESIAEASRMFWKENGLWKIFH